MFTFYPMLFSISVISSASSSVIASTSPNIRTNAISLVCFTRFWSRIAAISTIVGDANSSHNGRSMANALRVRVIFDSYSIKLEDFSYYRKHLLGLCAKALGKTCESPGPECLARSMRSYVEVIHDPVRARTLRATGSG